MGQRLAAIELTNAAAPKSDMLGQMLPSRKIALLPELDLVSSPFVRVGMPYLVRDEMIFSSLYWDSVEIPGDMPGLTDVDDKVLEELIGEGQIIKTWSSVEAYEANNERPSLIQISPELVALEERLGPSGGADYQHLAAWAEELLGRLPSDGSLSLLSKSLPRPASGVTGRRAIAARILSVLGVPTEATVREVLDFKAARRDELGALHLYLSELLAAVSSDDPEQGVRCAQDKLSAALLDYRDVMNESFLGRVEWKGLIGGAVLGAIEMALDVGVEAAIAALFAGGMISLFQTDLNPRLPAGHPFRPIAYAYDVDVALR